MEYNLADLWECVADTVPERDALIFGGLRLTYSDAENRINRLAHYLKDNGVQPGDRVALYLFNGNEYLEAMLAAFKIRAVPVNVNYRYVEEELSYLLNDSSAVALILHASFAAKIHSIKERIPATCFLYVQDDHADEAAGGLLALRQHRHADLGRQPLRRRGRQGRRAAHADPRDAHPP